MAIESRRDPRNQEITSPMELLFVILIILAGVFTQAATGFGLGLVAMPLLTSLIGLDMARPLVALVGLVTAVSVLIHYRTALHPRAVWRLMLGSICGIPLGFFFLNQFDRHIVEVGLGLVVVTYAVYTLVGPRLPDFKSHRWALGFGFVGGILSGAYNAGGPPAVIYANGRRWTPAEFKGSVQTYALMNLTFVATGHFASGSYTPDVLATFLLVLPAVVAGLFLGFASDQVLNARRFHHAVLGVLVIVGISLVL